MKIQQIPETIDFSTASGIFDVIKCQIWDYNNPFFQPCQSLFLFFAGKINFLFFNFCSIDDRARIRYTILRIDEETVKETAEHDNRGCNQKVQEEFRNNAGGNGSAARRDS